jgi:hypothetical protein
MFGKAVLADLDAESSLLPDLFERKMAQGCFHCKA